ncbi:hypothetical protein SYNTR_0899 [Candidatus Syntrophocurvum alkaliphilum]|uniref:Uncharacterized protein n=1 Tax=Candidatus Syntrophocurvum alkaliphilum TaxID=2293317 RepID=A0A6I6DEQ9_9FIRM|nr:hypothetical protein [Candidatus Syntrophocurvum alkaliphilum]QGT99492.1 hypothetical protein SYNTR_0899 [Candidatus Syntrophocurvum alkaliphilum]
MKLNFIEIQEIDQGEYPDLLHFFNNEAQVFFIKDGRLYGKITEVPYGEWDNRNFEEKKDISIDQNIKYFGIESMSGFGAIGAYKTGNIHRLLIYELQIDISPYLDNASIQYDINSPVSNFELTIENIENPDPEKKGNIGISEHESYLIPGAKINFKLRMGDSEDYDLGGFYIDRSNYRVLSHTANCSGRNLIGKALKDQSFDEGHLLNYNNIHEHIREILIKAGVSPYSISIQASSVQAGYKFNPSMDYLCGIEDILKSESNWKIEEKVDGTIIVGSIDYGVFETRGIYQFRRNKDIFSRNIVRDDMESYRRVCVHDRDFKVHVYKEVQTYQGWNLRGNKTIYIPIPEGTSESDANTYAENIVKQLEYVGKVESFTGPFRPYLLVGDEAVIIDDRGGKNLGLITQIRHRFGKGGFYTEFTVDSGGRIGQGRLTDYIGKITQEKSSNRIYDEE